MTMKVEYHEHPGHTTNDRTKIVFSVNGIHVLSILPFADDSFVIRTGAEVVWSPEEFDLLTRETQRARNGLLQTDKLRRVRSFIWSVENAGLVTRSGASPNWAQAIKDATSHLKPNGTLQITQSFTTEPVVVAS
jgi:hypothetical protein